jgi:electron transfer flavoprotein alpha/beta subunit
MVVMTMGQAKKKKIEKMKPADLGVDVTPRLATIQVVAPPVRQGGAKVRSLLLRFPCSLLNATVNVNEQVETVDEVVAKLKAAGLL